MKKLVGFVSVAAVALMVLTGNVLAAKTVQKTINIPADFSATIQTANCSSLPGPQVSLQSQLMPSGLQADIIFSNPKGNPPTGERFVVDQTVIPANSQVALPTQSIVAGAGNDPFIWLQLTDAKGQALTSEVFLGRCSQGSFNPTVHLGVPVDVVAELSSGGCDSPAPMVSINDGTADLQAINGKLIFRNTSNLHGGGGTGEEVVLDLVILPSGQSYSFPQQLVQGQISPDPLISLQLREGGGQPISNEIRLGRCSPLAN